MRKVAFVCVHNSCRSQIAEALCKKYRKDLIAYSAGTEIKNTINQDAVRIMKEKYDIDMSNQYSKLISDIPKCDIYISMGCNVECPFTSKYLLIKTSYEICLPILIRNGIFFKWYFLSSTNLPGNLTLCP